MPHVDGGAPFSVWRGKKLLLMGELLLRSAFMEEKKLLMMREPVSPG
jgi:hypothetical protein